MLIHIENPKRLDVPEIKDVSPEAVKTHSCTGLPFCGAGFPAQGFSEPPREPTDHYFGCGVTDRMR